MVGYEEGPPLSANCLVALDADTPRNRSAGVGKRGMKRGGGLAVCMWMFAALLSSLSFVRVGSASPPFPFHPLLPIPTDSLVRLSFGDAHTTSARSDVNQIQID